jgi:hypothetical protein
MAYEIRAPYMLVLHGENSSRTVLARKVMMVADEVGNLNKFFCKTGQLKRYYPDTQPLPQEAVKCSKCGRAS